jgi:restriction endonuclease S subunit
MIRTQPISEIAELIGGLAASYVLTENGPDGLPLPMISVGDLQNGRVAPTGEMRQTCFVDSEQVRRRQVQQGDIVVAAKGAAYRAALVAGDRAGAVASGNLIILRPGDRILPAALLAILTSARYETLIAGLSRGTTRAVSFSIKDLGALEIPVPAMARQNQLADLAEAQQAYEDASLRALDERRALARRAMDDILFADTDGGPA